MKLTVQSVAVVVAIASYSISAVAQTPCGKTDSISVRITEQLDKDEFPAIVLSAKNIGDQPLTEDSIDGYLFPRIHIEGVHGAPPRTIWYRQLSHEYGYPDLSSGPTVTTQDVHAPGETLSHTYPLRYYYFVDEPGAYSVYVDVHDPAETCDPNAKWLRTNTLQITVTPDQVKAWEQHTGAPRESATIKMQQPSLSLQQAPKIQIELQNDLYTDYAGDDFFPHVERNSVEIAKTTYFRERRHEPGTRQYGFMEGPTPDFPVTRGEHSVRAHQSSTWEIDLRNFYKFDAPGKYSVYVEFPDVSGKLLRTNTLEFEIAAEK